MAVVTADQSICKPVRLSFVSIVSRGMVKLSPEERQKLRTDWKQMSPEQRREWVQKNAPKTPREAPLPPPR